MSHRQAVRQPVSEAEVSAASQVRGEKWGEQTRIVFLFRGFGDIENM